ncbi:MAG: C-GCAxxG-C-C family protein [Chloroflexota bacterium]
MDTTTRRQFIKGMGGVTLGMVALSGIGGAISCAAPSASPPQSNPALVPSPTATQLQTLVYPWPYKKLDPIAAAERSYQAYYNGGCMYGAFEGIVGELRSVVGQPYTTMPTAMAKYGAAGVIGWGTLCGSLNGAAAAIYLIHEAKTGNPIINELFGWYGAESLPDYKPKSPKFANMVTSVAESQLCHQSVTRWCEKSGFKTTSPERAERCAWITASVVKYAVELLNKQTDQGSITIAHAVPASVTGCLSCHGKGGVKENVHISSQITCASCHDTLPKTHPALTN